VNHQRRTLRLTIRGRDLAGVALKEVGKGERLELEKEREKEIRGGGGNVFLPSWGVRSFLWKGTGMGKEGGGLHKKSTVPVEKGGERMEDNSCLPNGASEKAPDEKRRQKPMTWGGLGKKKKRLLLPEEAHEIERKYVRKEGK